jgi:cytochrome P450
MLGTYRTESGTSDGVRSMTSQSQSGRPAHFDLSGHRLHEVNDLLRAQGPATPVELPGGVVAWSVTRYDVMRRLADDPRVSRDAKRHWPAFAGLSADWPLASFVSLPAVLNAYGEDHRRLRSLIEPAFSPARTEALRAMVQGRVGRLVNELGQAAAAAGGGGGDGTASGGLVDLRNGYAYVISAETLCDLFGVPDGLREKTRRAIDALSDPSDSPEQSAADMGALLGTMGDLVAEKSTHPGPDMVSDLIAARVGDGDGLGAEEVVTTLLLTIGAGGPTTADLIANAAYALLADPDQRELVTGGLVGWPDVIEETLRAEAPVQHMPLRYAVEDIDLGDGLLIERGQPILLGFGASGRDPSLNPEGGPEDFDVTRPAKAHLAFGHGVHHCIGAPLARMQADIALSALFERFPRMELAVEPDQLRPQPTFLFNGLMELPVRLGTDPA